MIPILEGILQNQGLVRNLFDKFEVDVLIKTLPNDVKTTLIKELGLEPTTTNRTLSNMISEQENIK